MKPNIISTESRLKGIELPADLYEKAENLIDHFLKEDNLAKIKKISNSFGLKYDIKFSVKVVSAKEKYLFNYLSGAFGNKDLKNGAYKLGEFLDDPRFTKAIKHLSGRAIHSKSIIDKVNKSLKFLQELGYSTDGGSFVNNIRVLSNKVVENLKSNNGVILIGVSPEEELEPFNNLLAHEVFHLVLIKNGIWFQGIGEEYDYLDEGLTKLLENIYSNNKKNKALLYWSKALLSLNTNDRQLKLRDTYNVFKEHPHDLLDEELV